MAARCARAGRPPSRSSAGLALALVAASAPCASASLLSFFGASDVHFGHDVVAKDNTTTTALELNRAACAEMNALPNNDSWPAEMGGGVVQWPAGLIITGDLIDNGYTEGFDVDNFTATYGLDGTDGLIHFPVYVISRAHASNSAAARQRPRLTRAQPCILDAIGGPRKVSRPIPPAVRVPPITRLTHDRISTQPRRRQFDRHGAALCC